MVDKLKRNTANSAGKGTEKVQLILIRAQFAGVMLADFDPQQVGSSFESQSRAFLSERTQFLAATG